ncbi:MAG: hypothetical protein HZC26_02205 [Candidatus Magasanikbacteria bacterium]|nr:hypothetical protein [Candidatus Magasanikbacteria bacterium]
MYTFHENRAVLLHGFVKKSQRIAKKELAATVLKLQALDTL